MKQTKRIVGLLAGIGMVACLATGLTACSFLDFSEEHDHVVTKTEAVDSTCSQEGNIEYWTCKTCGRVFEDEEAAKELKKADLVVEKKPHTEKELPGEDATCTEPGLTEGTQCSVCDEILVEQKEIPAAGHKMTNHPRVAPQVGVAGKEEYWSCSVCEGLFLDEEGENATTEDQLEIPALQEPKTFTFEAEDAEFGNGSRGLPRAESNGATSGGKIVGNLNYNSGASLTYSVLVDTDTNATLYAAFNRRDYANNAMEEVWEVTVNGVKLDLGGIMLPYASETDWSTFDPVELGEIELKAGQENTIVFTFICTTGEDRGSNFDYIRLVSSAELQRGYRSVMQAEKGTFTGGSTGTPSVSNGASGQFVGGVNNNAGATLTYQVYAEKAGSFTLTVNVNQRTVDLPFAESITTQVNGTTLATEAVVPANAEGKDWAVFMDITLGTVQLNEGLNTIVFTVTDKHEGQFNFDFLRLSGEFEVYLCAEMDEVFEAEDSLFGPGSATSSNAGLPRSETLSDRTVVGNFNNNPGASLTFIVFAEEAAEVSLAACVTQRAADKDFDAGIITTVNGTRITTGATVPANEAGDWKAYMEVSLGTISLQKGMNVITLTTTSLSEGQFNVDYIKLTGATLLRAVY